MSSSNPPKQPTDIRLEIENIIVDTTLHPVDASLRIMELLTKAEVAAQLHILRGFRRRDFVRDDFYEHAVIDRISQLGGKDE